MFLCFRGKRYKSLGVSPYVLMFLCSFVYRVSGCQVTLRRQHISTLTSYTLGSEWPLILR